MPLVMGIRVSRWFPGKVAFPETTTVARSDFRRFSGVKPTTVMLALNCCPTLTRGAR